MTIDDIQTTLDIVNGIFTILALLAAAWWFFIRRALAGTLQITLDLADVSLVNNIPVAVVRVKLKNVGQTRIVKDYCACRIEEVEVWSDSEPLEVISKETLNYSQGTKIFKSQVEIEPNEETAEDIVIVLKESTLFTVGVWYKKKGTNEAWQAIATFNTATKTKDLLSLSSH